MFSTKPANDSRSTFIGVFGLHVVFKCLRFFLSISYYTGSLWLTSFCILAAFLSAKCQMRYLSSSLTLLPCARTYKVFNSLQNSNFSSEFGSTHSCLISANVLFWKGPLDISILFGIYCLLFCTKLGSMCLSEQNGPIIQHRTRWTLRAQNELIGSDTKLIGRPIAIYKAVRSLN